MSVDARAPVDELAVAPRRRLRWQRARRPFAAIGLVVALVAADAVVGTAWERVARTGHDGPIAHVSDPIGGSSPPFHDERADTPAMSGVSWSNDYFTEMREIRYEYWPFLLNRPLAFHGTYFNMDDWSRRTWEAPDDGTAKPVAWFFGGSALWGEGQRDLHTIPSEVARLAAADGIPIQAVNYGQSGWVLHQERALFEQLLADDAIAKPDLVAFYDGANEVSVQSELSADMSEDPLAPAPTHFGVARAREVLGEATSDTAPTATTTPASDLGSDLLAAYQRRSLLVRGIRVIRRAVGGDPAAAEPTDDEPTDDGPAMPAEPRGSDGSTAAAERAATVYVQDRAAARSTAAHAGAASFFFWQPEGLEVPGYRAAALQVGAPTVDLTDAFRGREDEIFMDLVHTNEAGAKAIAAHVYASMKPAIGAWHRAHR